MSKTGTIVIDPGHGGSSAIGGSSANNATSPSGVKEKAITLDLGLLLRTKLQAEAAAGGHTVTVLMTRDTDVNLSLADRAYVACDNEADLLLSIHCNGSVAHTARGVETWIFKRLQSEPTADRYNADLAFAKAVQKAAFDALHGCDEKTRDRGVKTDVFGVLNRDYLGPKPKACLLEVEFIDVKAVDELLNTGAEAATVRSDLTAALATALIDSLP